MTKIPKLSKREREVMDIIHALQAANVSEITERMEKPPSNAAVRSILRILVERGHLNFKHDGPRYIYTPTVAAKTAKKSALKHVLSTFFDGSVEGTIAALLELEESKLSKADRKRVLDLIQKSEKEGR